MTGGRVDARGRFRLGDVPGDRVLDDSGSDVTVDESAGGGIEPVARFRIGDPTRAKYLSVRSECAQAVEERFERDGPPLSPDCIELTGELALAEPAAGVGGTSPDDVDS